MQCAGADMTLGAVLCIPYGVMLYCSSLWDGCVRYAQPPGLETAGCGRRQGSGEFSLLFWDQKTRHALRAAAACFTKQNPTSVGASGTGPTQSPPLGAILGLAFLAGNSIVLKKKCKD